MAERPDFYIVGTEMFGPPDIEPRYGVSYELQQVPSRDMVPADWVFVTRLMHPVNLPDGRISWSFRPGSLDLPSDELRAAIEADRRAGEARKGEADVRTAAQIEAGERLRLFANNDVGPGLAACVRRFIQAGTPARMERVYNSGTIWRYDIAIARHPNAGPDYHAELVGTVTDRGHIRWTLGGKVIAVNAPTDVCTAIERAYLEFLAH